ncbi:MAG TPA: hypothetical protein VFE51_02575 [Verrucomicrobiae bacterium]|nr:hypothetical protein [Verrucomicrobiae bacterium]
MKRSHSIIIALALLVLGGMFALRLFGAETKAVGTYEYATIRWAGKENTHIVRPGGQVEFIGMELRKLQKPDRADDRAFYMNWR